MEKKVYLDKNADKELHQFTQEVQIEFEAYFEILRREGKLDFPESRKIGKNLFELRIKFKGEYRGFYAYVGRGYIIILHFFKKKTQKAPIRSIKTTKRRLKRYE